jgi:3-hydroxyisobutyrate dehydrogenase
VVWSRRPQSCASLVAAGAIAAPDVDAVVAQVRTVLLMLRGDAAIDSALGRGSEAFRRRVAGRLLVHLGTTAPEWSIAFERDVRACGGRYVEAPVSGSRGPAEQGALVGMLAGDPAALDEVEPLLAPLCRRVVRCGPVPGALRLKLAVNHYLITTVAALAETVHAAAAIGVDLAALRDVLDAGPMASDVSRTKLARLIDGDYAAQAAIVDVAEIARLVADQARAGGAHAPLIEHSAALFAAAAAEGRGALDMAAVRMSFDARSEAARRADTPPAPVTVAAAAVPSRSRRSVYPEPFARRVQGRDKKQLGNLFGLANFGVNLTRLSPGAISALRHAHSRQDEFVYVLAGHATLRTDRGAHPLGPGSCAGFRAGSGDAHQLVNETAADVLYLEIGDRSAGDVVAYPDDDLVARESGGAWHFFHRDGTPYV